MGHYSISSYDSKCVCMDHGNRNNAQTWGYAFNTSNTLHHCFNNALVHYQMLIWLVNAEVAQMVNAVPPPQMCHTETPTPPAPFSHNQYCDSSTEHAPSLLPIMLDESTPINRRNFKNAQEPPAFGIDANDTI